MDSTHDVCPGCICVKSPRPVIDPRRHDWEGYQDTSVSSEIHDIVIFPVDNSEGSILSTILGV